MGLEVMVKKQLYTFLFPACGTSFAVPFIYYISAPVFYFFTKVSLCVDLMKKRKIYKGYSLYYQLAKSLL